MRPSLSVGQSKLSRLMHRIHDRISKGQAQPFRAPRLPGARDSTTSLRCPHQPPAPTPVAGAGPGPWNPGAGVYSVYLGVSFSTCSFVVNYEFRCMRKRTAKPGPAQCVERITRAAEQPTRRPVPCYAVRLNCLHRLLRNVR